MIRPLRNGRKGILYVDNCSGHNETPEVSSALERINTELRYFEPNLTDYIQPNDSFLLQKVKSEWSTRWEKYIVEGIMGDKWTKTSGQIPNPKKSFFLDLAVKSVNDVNRQGNADGIIVCS